MTNDFLTTYNQKGLDKLTEDDVNYIIKANNLDTNKISDGFHCFAELYEHRIRLFIALCKTLFDWAEDGGNGCQAWRSKKHSDNTEWEGWFLLGLFNSAGSQITYHLPISYWDECDFAETLDTAPPFDGHTAADVLERLKNM